MLKILSSPLPLPPLPAHFACPLLKKEEEEEEEVEGKEEEGGGGGKEELNEKV